MEEQDDRRRVFEYEGLWLWRRSDSPNWHIYWCPPGSRRIRRRSTATPDLAEARRRLIAFASERRQVAAGDPNSLSLMDLLSDHVERVVARSHARWPSEEHVRRRWTEFTEAHGVTRVSDLTLDMQDRYVAWRMERIREAGGKGSTGTVQRELSTMRAALRSAWKRGVLASVPYIRSAPTPPPRDRTLTAEECRRLLNACEEPHLRRFVLLSLHTLQRPAAVLGLHVDQVDLVRRRIDFLPPGWSQSNKRRPVVPITAIVHRELEQAMQESSCGFIIEYGGRPVQSVKKSLATAAKRAGIDNVYPYVFRHTGATLLAGAGVPLRQIAGMLGHSDQRTTELYAKHHPDYLRDAADTMVALLGDAGSERKQGGDITRCSPARHWRAEKSQSIQRDSRGLRANASRSEVGPIRLQAQARGNAGAAGEN